MAQPSVYTETHLLLAVMDEDWDKAQRLLDQLSPGERRTLDGQLRTLRLALTDGNFDARDTKPPMVRALHGENPD